jgi:catechol 2,3-dioxygenase-like lactoylglutathione lyase family enzyme
MIVGLDNVGLAVRDLERSVAFYQGLGFLKIFANERGCTMSVGPSKIFLFPSADQETLTRSVTLVANPPGIDHLSFLVEDVDRAYAEIRSRGINFLTSPADQSWGARTAVLRDPDGNNLYLLSWLSPRQS